MRGDEQEPDLRCGTFGTSGHVTTKSSIRIWDVLYKSGVYASTVTSLTPGDLPYAIASRLRLIAWLKEEKSTLTLWQKSAEGIVIHAVGGAIEALHSRKAEKQIC